MQICHSISANSCAENVANGPPVPCSDFELRGWCGVVRNPETTLWDLGMGVLWLCFLHQLFCDGERDRVIGCK